MSLTNLDTVAIAIFAPECIFGGVILFALYRTRKLMADFTALNAATASLATSVSAVEAYIPTLTDASIQTNIDAATTAVQGAAASLAALVPAPAAPAEGQ